MTRPDLHPLHPDIETPSPGPRQKAVRRVPDPFGRPELAPVPYQPPLSKTERSVMRLLLKGMTEKQAAAQLGRSHNTVHVHVRNIYRKLGVHSRKMLYRMVQHQPELIPPEETRSAAA